MCLVVVLDFVLHYSMIVCYTDVEQIKYDMMMMVCMIEYNYVFCDMFTSIC